jgi:hypothetical protein
VLVIRGLASIIQGVAEVTRRGIALDKLITLFFTWALFDGLVSVGVRCGPARSTNTAKSCFC